MKQAIRLSFSKPQLTYAIIMAVSMCVIMSAVSTYILIGKVGFMDHWTKVMLIDVCVTIPVAIILGPLVRYLINRLYLTL